MNTIQIPPTALLLNALFEHGTDDNGHIIRGFDAWEKLGDGRGVTAGYCGFTSVDDSGTSDLKAVFDRFCVLQGHRNTPSEKWNNWTNSPLLSRILATDSSSHGHDFRQAQRDVGHELYELPALNHCAELGITTPLGIACIYDAGVQHGDGDDPDSLGALIREVREGFYCPSELTDEHLAASGNYETRLECEENFIEAFNSIRYANLSKWRDDGGTWFDSRGRCHALNNLCRTGALDLTLPLHVQSAEYDMVIRWLSSNYSALPMRSALNQIGAVMLAGAGIPSCSSNHQASGRFSLPKRECCEVCVSARELVSLFLISRRSK